MSGGDAGLRPKSFAGVIGQAEAVRELTLACDGALARGEMPGHMLLTGPAGTGKTTLAGAVADRLRGEVVPLFGVNMRSTWDAESPLLQLPEAGNTVIFVDEIHRMYRPVQEVLFTAMEDRVLYLGKRESARTVPLPPFTLIGATTDPDRLLTPMLDRFALIVRLRLYRPDELVGIARHAAEVLGVALDMAALAAVAEAAAGVPRVAIRLVRAARDHVAKGGVVGADVVRDVLGSGALVWRSEGRDAG